MAVKKASTSVKKAPKGKTATPRHLQVRLNESGWKALKILAAEQGKPMQGLVVEALNELMRRHGKPAVVAGPD